MKFKIFKDNKLENTIISEIDFVKSYCKKNGFTYEQEEYLHIKEKTQPEQTAYYEELATAYRKGVESIG